MSFFLSALARELRTRARDPWAALLWLGIPLALGALFTLLMGDVGPPTARLLLADQDDSFLSGALGSALTASPLADIIDTRIVTLAEGERLIDDGDGSALLVVPPGFGEAVLADEPVALELRTNPSQTILPAIVGETLEMLSDSVYYAHRLLGRPVATIAAAAAGEGIDAVQAAAIGQAIGQTAQDLEGWLLPPALTVEMQTDEEAAPRPNMALLFFPGVLVMALLLTAQGLAGDFWEEQETGTLQRFIASPQPLSSYVGAKFASAAMVFGVVSAVMLAAGTGWHDIRLAALPVAWTWLVVSGVFLLGLLAVLQLLAPNRKSGGLLTGILIFPLMMLGGSFFPFEAMPQWLAAIGRWSPNGAMVEQLKLYLLGAHRPATMALGFLVLLVAASALFGLVVLRQRSIARG